MANVPKIIAENRGEPGRLVLPCAWGRHPRPQSPRHADAALGRGENPQLVQSLRSSVDMFASIGLDGVGAARWSTRPSQKPSHAWPWPSKSEFFRTAPACDAPAATSNSRFRRLKRGAHADAERFFYSRPLLAQPTSHFPFVALAGLTLRLLRCNPTFRQPLINIVWMKRFSEFAVDDLRYSRCGPQFGRKTKLPRRAAKPSQDLALLCRRQLGRSPGMRLGFQSCQAVFAISPHPALNTSRRNTEKVRHFLLRIVVPDARHGQPSSPLQFGPGSMRSHTDLYACP